MCNDSYQHDEEFSCPIVMACFDSGGFFDKSTEDAVKKFQEVFNLTPDGIIGRSTWNMINFIYNAVKKLYTINSEGLRLDELETTYEKELKRDDGNGNKVSYNPPRFETEYD